MNLVIVISSLICSLNDQIPNDQMTN